MKVKVLKNGYVPVTPLVLMMPYRTGKDVFGVPVGKVAEMLAAGSVKLAPIPAGEETTEVEIAVRPAEPVQAAPEKKTVAVTPSEIEIPEGWREMHDLEIKKLAKQISPDLKPAEGQSVSDAAIAVIEEEMKRRNPPAA